MGKIETIEGYLDTLAPALQQIGSQLRTVLDEGLPDATGSMWHGHPVWKAGATPVAGFKAYPSYLTFMLWRGQQLVDGSGRLEPGSATMASVKLRTMDELDRSLFADWLRQAHVLQAT